MGNIITKNTALLGDFMELAKEFEDKSVDLVFADLPYEETANKLDVKIPFKFLWNELMRIIKPRGTILLFAKGRFAIELAHSNLRYYRYDIIWDKVLISNPMNARIRPLSRHEVIQVYYKKLGTYNPQFTKGIPLHSKGKAYLSKPIKNNNYGKMRATPDTRAGSTEKYPTSIQRFQKPTPKKARHRTEKPVPLLIWGIKTYSNKGDLVVDMTAGSGGIAEACMMTGRNFVLIEKQEEEYIKIIKRIAEVNDRLSQLSI